MQALIFKDKFDDLSITQSLYEELKGFKIVEVRSIRELYEAKALLDLDMPCLLYKNVFMRIQDPKEIWDFHNANNFNNTIKIGLEIVSFIPRTIGTFERDINCMFYLKPEFQILNKGIYFVSTNKKPLCFIYTHNRDVYLKLTLNSILFATQNIDLKIVLNDPTPQVMQVATEFAEKYKNIELFKTNNSFISATNLMIQWFNPERFIFMEDDMIYPPNTKEYFPNFCHQFLSRLDYFDLCLWKVTIDNCHSYIAHKRNTFEFLDSEWEIWEKNSRHILMAQCVACKTKFYIDTLKKHINLDNSMKKYHACYDIHLIQNANGVCHPSLRGYHIGWNQEMDGFAKLVDASRHPTFNSYKFNVKNLNTGETRKIDLRDLLTL